MKFCSKYGYISWRYGTAENVEITDIRVDEKRRGHGTELLRKFVNSFKDNPPRIIYLFTKRHNEDARKFYDAIGFGGSEKMGDNILYWQYHDSLLVILKEPDEQKE